MKPALQMEGRTLLDQSHLFDFVDQVRFDRQHKLTR